MEIEKGARNALEVGEAIVEVERVKRLKLQYMHSKCHI